MKRQDQVDMEGSSLTYYTPSKVSNDEIDLKELFAVIWQGKWLIILMTTVFASSGVFYALWLPNIYKAETVLVSAQDSGQSGLAGMAAQFSGLVSLAGINLRSGSSDEKALAIATLTSRKFINAFIERHDLLVPLIAAKGWDSNTNTVLIDTKMYDLGLEQWVRDVDPGQSQEPTAWESYKVFSENNILIDEAKDTGLVTVSVKHYSPELAQQWVTWLIEDLNSWIKEQSLNETKRNISYLEQQLEKTHLADMRAVFYQLIEEQTKNLMLAEVENEFVFKTIDPAVIPEEKSEPRRALICVAATLLGGMLGVATVFMRSVFKVGKEG